MASRTAGKSPANGPRSVDAAQAEAALSTYPVDGQPIEWKGKVFTLKPAGQWRQSEMRALRGGDFDLWAEAVFTPDSYKAWVEMDLTNDELGEFLVAWSAKSGEDAGK